MRANHAKKGVAPFDLEKVRDEDLYLISGEDWGLKPLSLQALIRLLQMVEGLLEDAGDLYGAMQGVTEEMLAEFISLLIRRPTEFVRKGWRFEAAARAVADFWDSPDRRYLAAGPREEPLPERAQEPIAWVTEIVERLSWSRGWTIDYILSLPFLAILKLLAALDERAWEEQVEMIQNVERGVARAVAAALGKGDALPGLPTYRETKRKLREAEEIKKKGQRFFEAALR